MNGGTMGVEPVLTTAGARRTLRRLELEAYASVMSAFRAQGPLTGDKKTSLDQLCKLLGISSERHRAEVRRAVNDELLSAIAGCVCTADSEKQWRKEGQKLASTNPRFVARQLSHLPHLLTSATASGALGLQGSKVDSDIRKTTSAQVQNVLKFIISQNPLSSAGSAKPQLSKTSVPAVVKSPAKQTAVTTVTTTATPTPSSQAGGGVASHGGPSTSTSSPPVQVSSGPTKPSQDRVNVAASVSDAVATLTRAVLPHVVTTPTVSVNTEPSKTTGGGGGGGGEGGGGGGGGKPSMLLGLLGGKVEPTAPPPKPAAAEVEGEKVSSEPSRIEGGGGEMNEEQEKSKQEEHMEDGPLGEKEGKRIETREGAEVKEEPLKTEREEPTVGRVSEKMEEEEEQERGGKEDKGVRPASGVAEVESAENMSGEAVTMEKKAMTIEVPGTGEKETEAEGTEQKDAPAITVSESHPKDSSMNKEEKVEEKEEQPCVTPAVDSSQSVSTAEMETQAGHGLVGVALPQPPCPHSPPPPPPSPPPSPPSHMDSESRKRPCPPDLPLPPAKRPPPPPSPQHLTPSVGVAIPVPTPTPTASQPLPPLSPQKVGVSPPSSVTLTPGKRSPPPLVLVPPTSEPQSQQEEEDIKHEDTHQSPMEHLGVPTVPLNLALTYSVPPTTPAITASAGSIALPTAEERQAQPVATLQPPVLTPTSPVAGTRRLAADITTTVSALSSPSLSLPVPSSEHQLESPTSQLTQKPTVTVALPTGSDDALLQITPTTTSTDDEALIQELCSEATEMGETTAAALASQLGLGFLEQSILKGMDFMQLVQSPFESESVGFGAEGLVSSNSSAIATGLSPFAMEVQEGREEDSVALPDTTQLLSEALTSLSTPSTPALLTSLPSTFPPPSLPSTRPPSSVPLPPAPTSLLTLSKTPSPSSLALQLSEHAVDISVATPILTPHTPTLTPHTPSISSPLAPEMMPDLESLSTANEEDILEGIPPELAETIQALAQFDQQVDMSYQSPMQ